jgi:hypothetical protein
MPSRHTGGFSKDSHRLLPVPGARRYPGGTATLSGGNRDVIRGEYMPCRSLPGRCDFSNNINNIKAATRAWLTRRAAAKMMMTPRLTSAKLFEKSGS